MRRLVAAAVIAVLAGPLAGSALAGPPLPTDSQAFKCWMQDLMGVDNVQACNPDHEES